jgi:predicted RNA-binding protein with TRAM domain
VHESRHQAFAIELPSRVAGILIGPGASRLDELEAETNRRLFFETRDDLPASHFAVLDRGPVSRLEGKALPVTKGQELDVKLEDVHLSSDGDAIARVNGYVIAVAGAKDRIGKTVKVKIERATRTVAYATLAGADAAGEAPIEAGTELDREDAGVAMTPKRSRGSRGGRGRGKKPAAEATEAKETAEAEKPKQKQKQTRTAKPKTKPEEPKAAEVIPAEGESSDETPKPKKKTRRGSRGGRNRKKKPAAATTAESTNGAEPAAEAAPAEPVVEPAAETNGADPEAKPRKKTRRGSRGGRNRKKKPVVPVEGADASTPDETPGPEPLAPVALDDEESSEPVNIR